MNGLMKLIIVAVLAVVVGAVVISKRAPSRPGSADPAISAATPVIAPSTQTSATAVPRLVDLGANACIPCKKMAPILEELKTTMAGKLQVDFVDVWKNPDAGKQYGVNLIPTQIFYDANGKELSRHEGFMPREDILARFKQHGIDLAK